MNPYLLTLLRLFFRISSRITPPLAVHVAAKMFTTPTGKRHRSDFEQEILRKAERFTIPYQARLELSAYRWGDKSAPLVLLAHGWTGQASSLSHFIDPLLAKGFQVVAYDGLAHGASPGKTANLIEWTECVMAAMNKLQEVHCIIGHSLGAGAIFIASSAGLNTQKLVLLAPLTDIVSMTDVFARYLAIPAKTIKAMRDTIAKKYQQQISKYGSNWEDIFLSRFQVPTLLIHDKQDKEVDWSNSNHIANLWPWAKFISTTGLGHRRILNNREVVEMVSEFVAAK